MESIERARGWLGWTLGVGFVAAVLAAPIGVPAVAAADTVLVASHPHRHGDDGDHRGGHGDWRHGQWRRHDDWRHHDHGYWRHHPHGYWHYPYSRRPWGVPHPAYLPGQWVWNGWSWVWHPGYWR